MGTNSVTGGAPVTPMDCEKLWITFIEQPKIGHSTWINHNDLTVTWLGIMFNKRNHPQMVLVHLDLGWWIILIYPDSMWFVLVLLCPKHSESMLKRFVGHFESLETNAFWNGHLWLVKRFQAESQRFSSEEKLFFFFQPRSSNDGPRITAIASPAELLVALMAALPGLLRFRECSGDAPGDLWSPVHWRSRPRKNQAADEEK